MFSLTKKDEDFIKEKRQFGYAVIRNADKKELSDWDSTYSYKRNDLNAEVDVVCSCKPSNKVIQKRTKIKSNGSIYCKYCHNLIDKLIIPKEFGLKSKNAEIKNGYYVKAAEDEILIYKYEIKIGTMKKATDEVPEVIKINAVVDVKIGQKAKAYKSNRGNWSETDLFDVLRINTKTIQEGLPVIYEDSNGLIDFLLKNKSFANKTGLIEFINLTDVSIKRSTLFFLYIYLLSEYPAIELLVKMGYVNLISQMFNSFTASVNKEDIRDHATSFKTLVRNTTKGSLALTIPKFAAEYLNDIEATYSQYSAYAILFSYESLTKEQFMKMITDDTYEEIFYYKENLFELLKYGYTVEKVLKYIRKQKDKTSSERVLGLLKDYNEMANLMDVEVDKYPPNVQNAHDNLQEAYYAKKNELTDKWIGTIAERCEKYIPENEKYTIVLPKCTNDFIDEGRNQHNCVASYVNSVANKNCIVFFIREKENPNDSYITAEYRHKRLYQIRYRYNDMVYNKEEKDYANAFCDKLASNEYRIYE